MPSSTRMGPNVSSTGKIKASRLQLVPRGSAGTRSGRYRLHHFAQHRNAQGHRIGHRHPCGIGCGSRERQLPVHPAGGDARPASLQRRTCRSIKWNGFCPWWVFILPTGSSLQGGTLTANIAVTGPATTATLAGPVEIDNTKLAGFDLGSKIQGLNPFGGTRVERKSRC